MRIVTLGTGGYHPNERRHTACLFLPEIGLVFDAGTSFFRIPKYLQTKEIDIFLTHAHLDHIIGLTYFLEPLYSKKVEQARIHANLKTLNAVKTNLFAETVFPLMPNYEFCELQPETNVGGNGVLRYCPLQHPGGSVGYRVDWKEASFAYITDSTVNGTYTEFVRGVDLLIHECHFSDKNAGWCEKTGHSHTSMVAQLAKEANVKKLVLTHIDPNAPEDDPIGIDVAQSIFSETTVAEDGMEIEI
ncbi:hypothetical protein MNBD_PLANCTO02-30 [hydrothermal vent metagenome]|uniref:Metallo-beta-lactamase domain-containing protein n=1 Tax=hydrothermal vent metagenome TaxID=652676 RepID=A0A3B1DLG6_9ZZZZ